ncbi:MAG: 1-phosphofructokinase, partial [Vallitaleaceae bacterium]|nr:1-phosphofructokinase [Vallitaleaceae bacterium]
IMIYTVTLNPAVDKNIQLKDFKVNQVNRADEIREDAGGKGINVSNMIKNLHGKSVALGICGGSTGAFILSQMDVMGLEHLFVRGKGQTRTNIKIVDGLNQTFTDINETGQPIDTSDLTTLEELLFTKLTADDFLVLAGSVPMNCPKDIYKKWTIMANKIGAKVILDADRDLLSHGIEGGPFLIKPNTSELEMLFGRKIETIDEAINLSSKLFQYGIQVIVISRGKEGCVVVTPQEIYELPALDVTVKSTVGAGDSMVAAIAYALDSKQTLEEAIVLGVAASSASIMQEGTIMGDLDTILQLKQQVTINKKDRS